jgi:hypothetical protein
VIIALVIWLASLFGGGSVQPFSLPIEQATERVKAHVSNPDRKAKAVDVLDRMENAEKAWTKACKPQIERLQELIKERATTPAEFEKVFTETKDQAATVQARLLELRFELKAQLTEVEWTAVFPAPAAAK